VLREVGYFGTPGEVTDQVIERLKITEEEQAEVLKNGQSKVRNKIAWARFYLAKAGIIDSSSIGMWRLTELWKTRDLKEFDVYQMFQQVHAQFKQDKSNKISHPQESLGEDKDIDLVEGYNYREELLGFIKGLSPSGFE
jgi:restriction system protein